MTLAELRAKYPMTFHVDLPVPSRGWVTGDHFGYARALPLLGLVEVYDLLDARELETQGGDAHFGPSQVAARVGRLLPPTREEELVSDASRAQWETFLAAAAAEPVEREAAHAETTTEVVPRSDPQVPLRGAVRGQVPAA